MSYFEYFTKNIQKQDSDGILGSCLDMCPEEEREMRERENLVHVLEVWGPIVRKYVKSFSRSAADNNSMTLPRLLRPYSVLKTTVQHLVLDVTKRKDVSTACIYDFVDDRLRAVRQDITVQRLPAHECTDLLEPMIRFYVFYGYKLSNAPLKDFDPIINKKRLLECLKWYLCCCNDDLTGLFSKLDINKDNKLSNSRELIESLYILCNLENLSPLQRYLELPKHIKSDPRLRLAYKIGVANLQGNFVRVCRLRAQLCPLAYCALSTYLPTLQRRALLVLSHAYNSSALRVPASALCTWLGYARVQDALSAAAHYGLATDADAESVAFQKARFLHDVPLNPYLSEEKSFEIDQIFTYK